MATRESERERAQGDLDALLSQLAMVAKALLIRNGEFFPFGATIGTRGKFALVTPVPEGDRPTAHEVVDAVLTDIRGTAASVRACGLVAMATTEAGGDAVRIELEHAQGSSLVISLPYARGDTGAFAYGDMEAQRVAPRVWVTPEPTGKPSRKTSGRTAPRQVHQGVLFEEAVAAAPSPPANPPPPAKPAPKAKGVKRADPAPPRAYLRSAERPAHEPARAVRATHGGLRTQPA